MRGGYRIWYEVVFVSCRNHQGHSGDGENSESIFRASRSLLTSSRRSWNVTGNGNEDGGGDLFYFFVLDNFEYQKLGVGESSKQYFFFSWYYVGTVVGHFAFMSLFPCKIKLVRINFNSSFPEEKTIIFIINDPNLRMIKYYYLALLYVTTIPLIISRFNHVD